MIMDKAKNICGSIVLFRAINCKGKYKDSVEDLADFMLKECKLLCKINDGFKTKGEKTTMVEGKVKDCTHKVYDEVNS